MENKIRNWLRTAMIIGGIVDACMVLIFLLPFLRIFIFGESTQFHTPQYEWSMRLVASLGAAWTAMLFWSAKKPFERKDILFFTVFPLMFGAYFSTVIGILTNAISIQFFILFSIITFVHCPPFMYIWVKAKKIDVIKEENENLNKNKPNNQIE